ALRLTGTTGPESPFSLPIRRVPPASGALWGTHSVDPAGWRTIARSPLEANRSQACWVAAVASDRAGSPAGGKRPHPAAVTVDHRVTAKSLHPPMGPAPSPS